MTSAQSTHDYTRRYWGHDYSIHRVVDGGQQLRRVRLGRGDQGRRLPRLAQRRRYDALRRG